MNAEEVIMKKYFVILISVLLLAPCVGAQTFKRTSKTPGFFIPKGAMQTGSRAEKLPPVEKMHYHGQPAQIVIDMQQQAQEKAKQEQIEKQKQEAFAKLKKEQEAKKKAQQDLEKRKQNAFEELEKEQQEIAENSIIDNKQQISTGNLVSEDAETNLNEENKPTSTAENGGDTKMNVGMELAKLSPEDEQKFTQIIEEYHSDVKAISQNKPVRNQRLIDMIADYTDTDRSI